MLLHLPLHALDLALCIRGTRFFDRWLMSRAGKECHSLAYRLRGALTERIRNEDPLVLEVGVLLAGGAGEYTALVNVVKELHK